MCQMQPQPPIVKDYLSKVMAIRKHIAIKHGHFGALHHISMHAGQPSLIKSWRATKGFVFRGNHMLLLKSTRPLISLCYFVYLTLTTQKQVPFNVTAIA